MGNHTRNLSPNTVKFAELPPAVALGLPDVISALVSVLRWRQVSKSLLYEILTRLEETDSFEMGHAEFGFALWPNLRASASEEKFCKHLSKMKEDMILSNCFAVEVAKPRRKRGEDGGFIGLPTLYLRGMFWNLFHDVQDEALKCDLFSLEKDRRRAKIRAIVKDWLLKSQARPIEKYKKKDEVKPAKPSLPCSCACASCQSCAAKPVTKDVLRPVIERTDRAEVVRRMGEAFETLFECGADWANLELDTRDYWRKISTEIGVVEQRLADAIKRHNKNGSLKLVGG